MEKMEKIKKAASITSQDVTDEELMMINTYAMKELTADDVFTFKAVLCDNAIDRDMEQFTDKALEDMRQLFLGKTVIKDHTPSADNQVARIYATEIEASGACGKRLAAHCYMVKTPGNADLIREIEGGIKKEGSVSCTVSGRSCSICGADILKGACRHRKGRAYNGSTCFHKLEGVYDAYEFSLVAVPAQRNAGVSKSAGIEEADGHEQEILLRARLTAARAKIYE